MIKLQKYKVDYSTKVSNILSAFLKAFTGMSGSVSKKLLLVLCSFFFTVSAFANDITGTWQQIDDKTGAAKAIITSEKESNNPFLPAKL